MNTNIHKTKLLEKAHNGGGKAQLLSDVGRYTYRKGGEKDPITPSGIKISLDGDGVAVTGNVYTWDEVNNVPLYRDINKYFIDPGILENQTPELIELEIDRIIRVISKPTYEAHNPPVR